MRSPGTLAARRVTKFYGAKAVLEDVSLAVPPHARLGVVGPNGSGKTTLLRLLAGLEEPDAGTIERTPTTLTVGYLPQEPDLLPGEAVLDYLARRAGVADAGLRVDELAAVLADDLDRAAAHADALDRFLALGGDDFETRARATAAEVGIPAQRLAAPAEALSGGQRARVALAAILVSRFDVLLLDEPTNDLDFAGLALLEGFLATTGGALVVVSHDRELLDRVSTRIVELEEGGAGVREWAGGWSDYEQARAQARRRQYEEYDRVVEERERLEQQARRMSEWEQRGYGQGRKKKKTKDVKGLYRRRLARLERDGAEKPFEPWELKLQIAAAGRGGDVVARLSRAVVERGAFRLGPLDLELRRGDRLALAGPNGSGKTTLLGALLGRLPLAEGSRELGSAVEAAELEQGRERFAGDETLLEAFTDVTRLPPEDARTLLAKFGLGADEVVRTSSSLSPGERTRAALAVFAARGVNLLVLDEPTNHLDLPAIEQLEEALERYEGALVVVSHDRRFLERVAATRTLDLRGGRS
ncbi:MAG TPA: ABC-F family ATP-binding cassette domain-containing protein [Gaiellaceae bacterium]|nr:ABC-F family ATP-binding cassette domain-containing protein [Gaiellaceae bacterium]